MFVQFFFELIACIVWLNDLGIIFVQSVLFLCFGAIELVFLLTLVLWILKKLLIFCSCEKHTLRSFHDEAVVGYGVNEEAEDDHGDFEEPADVAHEVDYVIDSSFVICAVLT